MWGGFTYKLTWEELVRLYRLTLYQPAGEAQAQYNVCPTDPVDTFVECDGKCEFVPMRWGLIPSCSLSCGTGALNSQATRTA